MPVDSTDSFGRTSLHHAGTKNASDIFKHVNIIQNVVSVRNRKLFMVHYVFVFVQL